MGIFPNQLHESRLWRLAALFAALTLSWSPAQAATSDVICGQLSQTANVRYPRVEDLRRATQKAEAQTLAVTDAAGMQDAFEALDVPLDSTQATDLIAQAEYCTAAGEVMRRSPKGSQFQAQTYLLNGYRLATLADAEKTASRAAFRLGLVSSSGSAVAGARGGARSARRSSQTLASEVRAAHGIADAGCSRLQDEDIFANANGYIAEIALQCAGERALAVNDPQLAALAGLRLARLRLGRAESAGSTAAPIRVGALSDALAALPVAATVPEAPMRAELSGRLLAAALDLGAQPAEALEQAVGTMRSAAPDDPGILAYADAIEARFALLGGDKPRAMALLGRAILHESQRSLPARLPEYYLLLAEADPERRDQHAFAAYTALNNVRPLLPRTDPLTEESTFSLYMRRVFEAAVDSELAVAPATNEALRIGKAQQIIEAYRQAELQSVFGSECLPARDALRPEQLRADELLLYPILLPDRIELLYVSGADASSGDVRYHRLPPNRSANRETVSRLVEAIVLSMGYTEGDAWREPARALYDILIAPIEDQLRPGSMLAIIPDGPLRALPFAALLAADGTYLIQ